MRLIEENFKDNSKKLIPESLTDMYVLQNLIDENDIITSKTHRRIRKTGTKGREGDKGERITMTLTIQVSRAQFQESEVDNRLRIKGIIVNGPEEYISIGSSHTINIVIGQMLTIQKEKWLMHHKKYLDEAIKSSQLETICLIALEKGIATIGLLDNLKLIILSKIHFQIPGKIATQKQRNLAIKTFFKRILDVIKHQVENRSKIYVLGSPGNLNIQFLEYLKENWSVEGKKIQVENISSGTSNGIYEIINRGVLDQIAQEYQILTVEKLVEEFILRLATAPNKVGYGIDEIIKLLEMGSIDTILVSDRFYRTSSQDLKDKFGYIYTLIEQTRCKFYLVDYSSDTGKKIQNFGNIIGLLRFEVPLENE